jgi:hypothetical protein
MGKKHRKARPQGRGHQQTAAAPDEPAAGAETLLSEELCAELGGGDVVLMGGKKDAAKGHKRKRLDARGRPVEADEVGGHIGDYPCATV